MLCIELGTEVCMLWAGVLFGAFLSCGMMYGMHAEGLGSWAVCSMTIVGAKCSGT